MRRTLLALFSAANLLVVRPAAAIETGVFDGRVADGDGRPVDGAMITATHRQLRRGTTVYSDATGAFRLPPLDPGVYDIRVRRLGFQDLVQQGSTLSDGTHRLDLVLMTETEPHELAWQLPSSLWMPLLLAQLSSDEKREEFTRQCTFCHQQGSWATRVPRSAEDWDKIFKLMARMGGIISPALRAELPHAFNTAYDEANYLPQLQDARSRAPTAPTGGRTVITEWDLGHPASMQHDLAVHPDGTIYSVDTNQDQLYRLDPRTNERKAWDIPRGDSPLGGVFNVTGTLLAPNSNAHVAPHSLQVGPDGAIWVTLCLGNKVGRFDPRTEQWQIIEQKDGLYPHTLRFDRRGRVWYTLAVSNHVGMIDPKTGEQRTIRLPARTWGQAIAVRVMPMFLWAAKYLPIGDQSSNSEGMNLPVPYGIDIAADGAVWFSQLNEHRIGRIDPDSNAITLIETPFPGPRRLRFDSKGNLWIPGFSAGVIARYSLATGEFKAWKLPINGVETPYALNVDRRTDTVWICGTNSDTLIRFDPATETFTVFPLPTRVTYTREIDFDDAGGVWASNSNFPTWQIEAAGPKVIRLEPDASSHVTQLRAQAN
ncbi:MAG TPA: carboxypeptidase regulatory-like domain-containing protein [Candidatus Binatia bacterium]|nr:carboxypeptidase regulatory-like domain-containing protein [Candidatus Binatia bacterium]